MPELPDRQSIRLPDFDYSTPRAYFVTVCAHGRECRFGAVKEGRMACNPLGVLIEREILLIRRRRRPWIDVAVHVVMPNHIHMIVANSRHVPQTAGGNNAARTGAIDRARAMPKIDVLGSVIGAFKSGVTREARRLGYLGGNQRLWMRNYYEHVIRDSRSAQRIEAYIRDNPGRWRLDAHNRDRTGADPFDGWLKGEGRRSP